MTRKHQPAPPGGARVPTAGALPVPELEQLAASYNPRRISGRQMRALRRSLRRFGAVQPVLLNRRSKGKGWPARSAPVIVGGHQRVIAAASEHMAELPVSWVDLDSVGERQLNLALNRISGDWDQGKLREVVEGLAITTADLGLTGFSDGELRELLPAETIAADAAAGAGQADGDPQAYGGATAMARTAAPIRLWSKRKLLVEPVLDLGSGREQHRWAKYDPFHAPDVENLRRTWRTVMCNYVLNVQPAVHLIVELLALMFHLVEEEGTVLIAVRSDVQETGRTSRGFQRRMAQEEWGKLLAQLFTQECIHDADGFYAFKCQRLPAPAARKRRRVS